MQPETLLQIMAGLYVAFCEAGGPQTALVANRVLRDALADGVIDDPYAIAVLQGLAEDDDALAHELQ